MKILKKSILFLLFLNLSAFAALELELTQGMEGALPISINPFKAESALEQSLTSVIKADLQNSGRFHVLGEGRKVDNMLVGKVTKAGPGQFKVEYDLVDTVNAQNSEERNVLLTKTYAFSEKNARAVAHRIADDVFQKLIGKRGVFSTKIAYVLVKNKSGKPNKYHLMVADADGHSPHPLLTSDEPIMSPRWAPDGKRIAYVSFEKKRASIYVQDIHTGKRDLVSQFYGINGAPAWSPDTKRLAIVLSKSGHPNIYILDMDTKELKQLTNGWSIDTEPAWSPDGRTLIFTSNRSGGPQIYQIDPKGGQPERVTYNGTYNTTASFTRDGHSIVMLHKDRGMFVIAMQDLDTDRVDILTDTGRDQSPSLSPNDDMVLFATRFGRRQVLGMVSVDSRVRLRLPAQEGDVREPAWSPV